MGIEIKPIVKKINDNIQGLKEFQESLLQGEESKEKDILLVMNILINR